MSDNELRNLLAQLHARLGGPFCIGRTALRGGDLALHALDQVLQRLCIAGQ